MWLLRDDKGMNSNESVWVNISHCVYLYGDFMDEL